MITRRIFRLLLLAVLVVAACFLISCIIRFNSVYDVELLFLRNNSSRKIYYQYFLASDVEEKPGAFWTIGETLDARTKSQPFGQREDIIKVLIIDAESRKLLAKIAGKTFKSKLTLDIRKEKNIDSEVTYYDWTFTITDELLEQR
jgi:hypothetical protein